MAREDNIRVFEDTEAWCRTNRKIAESLKASQAAQELILETDALPDLDKNRYEKPAKVVVSKKRTLEAARGYAGQKVAVHNFASATNPGGGVTTGAGAQEECICRCSTLYFCLKTQEMQNRFYTPHRQAQNPIHNDDIIYTPEVLVFKTVPPCRGAWMKRSGMRWMSSPALHRTCGRSHATVTTPGMETARFPVKSRELMAIHDKRLRRMLDTALAKGAETVILGAFGCGAFENNPEVVAMAAKNVLKDYLHAFCNLEFAVYCTPRDENNYRVFERVLRGYCKA